MPHAGAPVPGLAGHADEDHRNDEAVTVPGSARARLGRSNLLKRCPRREEERYEEAPTGAATDRFTWQCRSGLGSSRPVLCGVGSSSACHVALHGLAQCIILWYALPCPAYLGTDISTVSILSADSEYEPTSLTMQNRNPHVRPCAFQLLSLSSPRDARKFVPCQSSILAVHEWRMDMMTVADRYDRWIYAEHP